MATLKQRLHKKNSSGSYDTVHLETSASLVLMSNGTSVEDKIAAMDTTIADKAVSGHTHSLASIGAAASSHSHLEYSLTSHTHSGYASSSHNHSASNITSGTLPLTRGGTGVTTIAALKSALGLTDTGGAMTGTVKSTTSSGKSSTTFSLTITSSTRVVWILGVTPASYDECVGPIFYNGSSWISPNLVRINGITVTGTTMKVTIQTGSLYDEDTPTRTLYYMI